MILAGAVQGKSTNAATIRIRILFMEIKQTQIPLYQQVPSLDYAQIFTASSIMFDTGKGRDIATFDVTIREMPGKRNFLLLGGIEEMVNVLLNWSYEKEFVDYLVSEKIISKSFGIYLKNFKFKGDVYCMTEGTVFFPGEPVIRVTTSLCDANLLTAFLVNVITYPTLLLSKAARVRLAVNGKHFYFASAMRAFGFENVLKIQRIAYILGSPIVVPYASYHFKVGKRKPSVGFYHALIKSFPSEQEAYRHFLPWTEGFGVSTSMVDTYDIKKGIKNWIIVEKEARKNGKSLGAVSIDSGDVFETSKFLRKELDKEGLQDTFIVAYSNLDEFKIAELEKKGAKIDVYCAFTETITSSDRPVLEVVYKLAETIDKNGIVRHAAKLTPGKTSLPGRKQVFRKYKKNGEMEFDSIGIEDEHLGKPLLSQYIKNGKLINKLPSLDEIKDYIDEQLLTLPKNLREIGSVSVYPVKLSSRIGTILNELKEDKLK